MRDASAKRTTVSVASASSLIGSALRRELHEPERLGADEQPEGDEEHRGVIGVPAILPATTAFASKRQRRHRKRPVHVRNHGLGEIVTALLGAGMTITGLVEHDSVPWEALPRSDGTARRREWRLRDRPERLPHTYTLQAVKRR